VVGRPRGSTLLRGKERVRERLEIKDSSTPQPYQQLPHGGRPRSLNRRERGRERERERERGIVGRRPSVWGGLEGH
jgi:hypothetical protein